MSEVQTTQPNRKEREGEVVSDKMKQTIVVRVKRRVHHPIYRKAITLSKKFYAHDPKDEAKTGDMVIIRETRPISKLKHWELVKIVRRANVVAQA
ncbi:MAG: 30S ribosomal protein S17 [Pedosphaera sp.]|nr:30S ribosomal protein S17 [Pedosphaera sp.]MSU42766.1 30S ribosomal protein S17 [Pedosphaera sp.]